MEISPHNSRAEFLHTLAILMGFNERLPYGLPDGRRPDVLRLDLSRQRLFIGEAKDSETPGATAMQARMQRYFDWLAIHVNMSLRSGMFAVCFGQKSDAKDWIKLTEMLAYEASVSPTASGVEKFGTDIIVGWITFHP